MRRRALGAGPLLGVIFVASVAVRIFAASMRTTPLYYPDEYIYASLARSIASTGVPSLRGQLPPVPSLLGPYLMAPGWLFGSVSAAYHVVLDLGAVWFSAAVFPAYAIARRIGVSARGGVVVALLAVLVPDAAFATTAMTEPYAYMLFLTTVFFALDAIVSPTTRRQVGVVLLMAALCLIRLQFVFVPAIYFLAAFVQANGSVRRLLRSQPVVIAAVLLGVVLAAALGPGRIVGVYSGVSTYPVALPSITRWFGVNLFVLAVAAGWALVPAAVSGLWSFLRSGATRARTFAVFTVATIGVLAAEAAFFGAAESRVHERYTFYAAPLLAAACVWAVEAKATSRLYVFAAYALAAAAIVVPATGSVRAAATDQSPTMLALRTLGGGGDTSRLVWAVALLVVIVFIGLMRGNARAPIVLAILISTALCVAGTRDLVRFGRVPGLQIGSPTTDAPRLGAPPGTALVTWAGTDRFQLMKTLFWNPSIRRVLVLDGGAASDGFASTPMWFRSPVGIVDRHGRPIAGPFAFVADTSVAMQQAGPKADQHPVSWIRGAPRALILGLNPQDEYLDTAAELLVAPGVRPVTVRLTLSSVGGRKSLTFDCAGRKFEVSVGQRASLVALRAKIGETRRCRISLTRGAAVQFGNRIVSGVQVRSFTAAAAAGSSSLGS